MLITSTHKLFGADVTVVLILLRQMNLPGRKLRTYLALAYQDNGQPILAPSGKPFASAPTDFVVSEHDDLDVTEVSALEDVVSRLRAYGYDVKAHEEEEPTPE